MHIPGGMVEGEGTSVGVENLFEKCSSFVFASSMTTMISEMQISCQKS